MMIQKRSLKGGIASEQTSRWIAFFLQAVLEQILKTERDDKTC